MCGGISGGGASLTPGAISQTNPKAAAVAGASGGGAAADAMAGCGGMSGTTPATSDAIAGATGDATLGGGAAAQAVTGSGTMADTLQAMMAQINSLIQQLGGGSALIAGGGDDAATVTGGGANIDQLAATQLDASQFAPLVAGTDNGDPKDDAKQAANQDLLDTTQLPTVSTPPDATQDDTAVAGADGEPVTSGDKSGGGDISAPPIATGTLPPADDNSDIADIAQQTADHVKTSADAATAAAAAEALRHGDAEDAIAGVQAQLDTVTAQRDTDKTDITRIEGEQAANAAAVATDKTAVAGATSELAAAKKALADAKASNDSDPGSSDPSGTKDTAALEAAVAAAQGKLDAANSALTADGGKLDASDSSLGAAKADLAAAEKRMAELAAQLQQMADEEKARVKAAEEAAAAAAAAAAKQAAADAAAAQAAQDAANAKQAADAKQAASEKAAAAAAAEKTAVAGANGGPATPPPLTGINLTSTTQVDQRFRQPHRRHFHPTHPSSWVGHNDVQQGVATNDPKQP